MLHISSPVTTQNLLNSIDNKWFVPAEWLLSSWYDLTINLVTELFYGNITGNLVSYGKNSAYFSRLMHLVSPTLSNSGGGLASLMHVEILLSPLKGFIFLFEIFFLWFVYICVHLPFSAGLSCPTSRCSFIDLLFLMNCLMQSVTLNSLFQFENL